MESYIDYLIENQEIDLKKPFKIQDTIAYKFYKIEKEILNCKIKEIEEKIREVYFAEVFV